MAATQDMIQHPHPQPMALDGKALEQFVVHGNLSVLSPQDKTKHYIAVCESLGLNPATKPFEYITLNGKEVMYARSECTTQLRKIHSVSIEIVERKRTEDLFIVTARALLPNGRKDEAIGALAVGSLKGEALANALMKAETKAKRRVTLSICGLGLLDESELEGDIERDRFAEMEKEQNVVVIEPKKEAPAADDGLPDEIPARIGPIPPVLVKAYYAQLNGLGGIDLVKMNDDDLDLVANVFRGAHEKHKVSGKKSEHGLAWLKAIADQAADILYERNNHEPPQE